MNKKNKTYYLGLIVAVAFIVFCAVIVVIVKPMHDKFKTLEADAIRSSQELQKVEAEKNAATSSLLKEKESLKNIKDVFEADASAGIDNLSIFGSMFDDVIQRIQQNGLMIRAIEYQMNPSFDPLSISFSKDYNVCTLKFFLVGTYSQLKTLLLELHNQFPYLVGLSKVNVLVYKENTDYILTDLSVTLYSKKPKEKTQNKK